MDSKKNPRIKEAKDLKFPQDFFNIKCIIFSLYIAASYWFLPRNKISLISITNNLAYHHLNINII